MSHNHKHFFNMEISQLVEDSDRLIAQLGHWPAFHDDEVISFQIEAEPKEDHVNKGTSVRLSIHVRRYEELNLGTAQYAQKMNTNLLVHLLFYGVRDLELSDFDEQNVIYSLNMAKVIAPKEAGILVDIDSSCGFGGSFRCDSIRVESVEVLPLD